MTSGKKGQSCYHAMHHFYAVAPIILLYHKSCSEKPLGLPLLLETLLKQKFKKHSEKTQLALKTSAKVKAMFMIIIGSYNHLVFLYSSYNKHNCYGIIQICILV